MMPKTPPAKKLPVHNNPKSPAAPTSKRGK